MPGLYSGLFYSESSMSTWPGTSIPKSTRNAFDWLDQAALDFDACPRCNYGAFPGGQPSWPWGNWRERATDKPARRSREQAAHGSKARDENRIKTAIAAVKAEREGVISDHKRAAAIQRQAARAL